MRRNEYIVLFPLLKHNGLNESLSSSYSTRKIRFTVSLENRSGINYDTLEPCYEPCLTICGSSDRRYSGDQGIDRIVEEYRERIPKSKLSDFDRIVDIWHKWHLNDMRPGTKAQQEAIAKAGIPHSDMNWYDRACYCLKECGLYEDRGYKFGHGWLVQPIEYDDLAFLNKIICAQVAPENKPLQEVRGYDELFA